MRFPRPRMSLRTSFMLVAILGLLSAWPGRWVYERIMRRMIVADIRGHGGAIHYGDRGYGVSLGDADPGHLKLFNDATSIDLSGTEASDVDLEPLRDSKSLVLLNLTGCRITAAGLAKLAGLANLEYLFLGDTKVTDEGLKHISSLSNLEILVLDNTQIGDPALASLVRLGKLRQLSLWGTRVSDRGALRLRSLSALDSISLPVSDETVSDPSELQRTLPGVGIYRKPTTIPR
jgi:hypothetical protein